MLKYFVEKGRERHYASAASLPERGNTMKVITVKASSFARLDSSVTFGGGTDETAAFQAVLDQAKDDNVGLHIVMDGAALVSQLVLYSDTTIECLNRDCGFFQKNGSDRALVTNGNWNMKSVSDHDITLTGGTYNQNAPGQKHHVPMDDSFSVRKYWDVKHLHIVVSTNGAMPRGCAMLGGGDHGGPVTTKIDFPRNWESLVSEYKEYGNIHYV